METKGLRGAAPANLRVAGGVPGLVGGAEVAVVRSSVVPVSGPGAGSESMRRRGSSHGCIFGVCGPHFVLGFCPRHVLIAFEVSVLALAGLRWAPQGVSPLSFLQQVLVGFRGWWLPCVSSSVCMAVLELLGAAGSGGCAVVWPSNP